MDERSHPDPPETGPAPDPGRRRRPRHVPDSVLDGGLAVVLALAVLVALAALVRATGGSDLDGVDIPELRLVRPADGEVVAGRLELVFEAGVRLTRNAHGWGTGPLHLHAGVDGADLMPGGLDVRPLPDGGYAWTLPIAEPGEYAVRMYWSGPDHAPLAEGATPAVRVELVAGGEADGLTKP